MQIALPVYRKDEIDMKPVIYQFQGEHRWLSNFWPCQVTLPAEGPLPTMDFTTVENAYMAWKTTDLDTRLEIQNLKPGEAKRLSYSSGFIYRKPYTDEMRVNTIHFLLQQKFSPKNLDLLQKLIETKDALIIEGNIHCDTFFGFDLDNGCGLNHLGRSQMAIRKIEIQKLNQS